MTQQMTLPAIPPFSISSVVGSHGWVKLAPFESDDQSGELTYVDRLDSGKVTAIRTEGTEGGVRVTLEDHLNETDRDEITRKITWMFGLEQDLSAFYTLAREEPKLTQMEQRAQGRLLRSPTLFEDVVKTILTTNTTWSGTIRMVKALVDHFGATLPGDPARHAFPTPDQLAGADEETLRTIAKLGYRAPYVLELARNVASGSLDLESLKKSDLYTQQLRGRLLDLKGVGEYAAANLLMILGRYDFIPVDSWALKIVSHEWYQGEAIGRQEVEQAFSRWGEWKGLAFWFWNWSYFTQGDSANPQG